MRLQREMVDLALITVSLIAGWTAARLYDGWRNADTLKRYAELCQVAASLTREYGCANVMEGQRYGGNCELVWGGDDERVWTRVIE